VVTKSVCARIATALFSSLAPVTTPGGNPVTDEAVFGLIARLPVIVVEPVLVIADAAITVKLPAESRRGCATEAAATAGKAPRANPEAHAMTTKRRDALKTAG
jgi:hypothetical protein